MFAQNCKSRSDHRFIARNKHAENLFLTILFRKNSFDIQGLSHHRRQERSRREIKIETQNINLLFKPSQVFDFDVREYEELSLLFWKLAVHNKKRLRELYTFKRIWDVGAKKSERKGKE